MTMPDRYTFLYADVKVVFNDGTTWPHQRIHLCKSCGAIVGDTKQHDDFHGYLRH